MLTHKSPTPVSPLYQDWQSILRTNIRDASTLLQQLGLEASKIGYSESGIKQFPVNVTQSFIARMQYGNQHDPLLRQVFPYKDESIKLSSHSYDPLNERNYAQNTGLIQKYAGRALLILTGACAIHCRYCFRRHFPYTEFSSTTQHWPALFEQIGKDQSLSEIILSGGDPLSLSDKKLSHFIQRLADYKHIKRLRIHTRLPIVLPERISQAFIDMINQIPQQVIIVLHINHANEINQSLIEACNKLKQVKLLNQSVLLQGVNDDEQSLIQLHQRLFEVGIDAYYLHQLDQTQGTAHYAVSDKKAKQLMAALQQTLPGYMVPNLVREIPGELHKTRL